MVMKMGNQNELGFFEHYLKQLSQLPLVYPDHAVPYTHTIRPKNVKQYSVHGSNAAKPISVTFKVMKSSATTTMELSMNQTIQSIKYPLLQALNVDPTEHVAKVLFKGKVLVDEKLVQDYPGLASGVTLNVMLSPGTTPPPQGVSQTMSSAETHRTSTSSQPPPQEEQDSPTLQQLNEMPAFWSDVRKVIDKHVTALGIPEPKLQSVRVLAAFQQALQSV